MPSDAAALSAIASAIDELAGRLSTLGAHYEGSPHDDLLTAIYEAERQLAAARRTVDRAVRLAP